MDFSGFGALGGAPSPAANPYAGGMSAQLMALGRRMNAPPTAGVPAPANNGGVMAGIQRLMNPAAAPAPAVPADGSMQATIGPGAAPAPAAPQAPVKMGLPPGGILGLMQGQSPQGLMGLLQRAMPGAGAAPMAGMPQAGMLPSGPNAPLSLDPSQQPTAPQLPTDINPMNQF